MYRFDNGQIALCDFGQPIGMNLKESNRWVKKAQLIPWKEIEKRYAKLFANRKGNVAKSLQLGLGACLIQAEYGYSDVETTLQIQENAYLQYFCGYKEYNDDKPPFDASMMVYFRKRLTPEILGEINEMIITAQEEKAISDNSTDDDENSENDSHDDNNSGTMIVDATCAPSQIKYPQDAALLNEAREITEKVIDTLHTPGTIKPRTYRKQAHKDFLTLARCRKPSAKKIRKAIGKQLQYLRRNLGHVDTMLQTSECLCARQHTQLHTVRTLFEQQKFMFENRTHSVANRIVSISQPYVRPIVRGKAKAAVEFGAKLDISVCNGFARLEVLSFDAYNEAGGLQEMVERYKQRTGHYPERVLADKIYRNRDNLGYCKEHGIRLSGPALGRPKKDAIRDKAQDYRDECERVEVERCFSLAKRKCGLGLITARLEATACHCIAMSVLVLNLRKIQCAFLDALVRLLEVPSSFRKLVIIQ